MPFSYTKKGVGERVDIYPFAHTISLGLAVSAIDLLLRVGPSPEGQYLVFIMAFFAVAAGLSIVTGLQWRGSAYMAYGIERFGHFLAIGAWLIDLYVLWTLTGWSLGLVLPFLFLLAHWRRIKRLGGLQVHLKQLIKETREAGAQE